MRVLSLITITLVGVLPGCRELPEPIGVGPHPAEPFAGAPASRYRSVTDGLRDYQIVQPKAWGDVNKQVAPKKK